MADFVDFDSFLSARRAHSPERSEEPHDIQAAISEAAQRLAQRRTARRAEELEKLRAAAGE
eukprot:1351941-Prymnesium_polylepis.1